MRFTTIAFVSTILVTAVAPAMATYGGHCSLGQWYWNDKKVCIKVGGPALDPNPPAGQQCPIMWFWNTGTNCCAPRYIPPPNSQPWCNFGWVWDPSTFSCKQPATPPPLEKDCGFNEWWWWDRSCCLPYGNPSYSPPPQGHNCPPNWYWSEKQGCCVPHHPPPAPVPSCSPGWKWSPYTQSCKPSGSTPPGPQPSHRPRAASEKTKRNQVPPRQKKKAPQHKKKAVPKPDPTSFCPVGLTACPLAGIFSTESECIDTLADLKSCGGCASVSSGQDCSAIPNVSVSSCDSGSCIVLSCSPGYAVSKDKRSCVTL